MTDNAIEPKEAIEEQDEQFRGDDLVSSDAQEPAAVHSEPPAEETAEDAPVLPIEKLPFSFAKRHWIVAIPAYENNPDKVCYTEQCSPSIFSEVRRHTGKDFVLEKITKDEFDKLLVSVYQQNNDTMAGMEDLGDDLDLSAVADELVETEDLLESADDAPIIKLVTAILTESIKEGASDIHIETFENKLVVRFRKDGVLNEVLRPNRQMASLLVSRIKVMAKLDIAEKRVPQDGRIALKIAGKAVDVRVSTMPSSHGERVVMRLLDKSAGRLELTAIGMLSEQCNMFAEVLAKPHGIILVTGPTGSGKTTTLYAGLNHLNSPDRNILTVEDPIEYVLDGVGQTQVNTKVDMTFAKGLRAMLRQDPDVVMVGEIRDLETAQIAVQASLTGHLVLSTLHTNTAVGAVTRMRDMGIEPFLLSSSLIGVLAQRLVRRLCQECRRPREATLNEIQSFDLPEDPPPILYQAEGCSKCNNTGYVGRCGIYELIPIDDKIREMIHKGAGEQEMVGHARTYTPSIRQNGRHLVLEGLTTFEEVLRVTREG